MVALSTEIIKSTQIKKALKKPTICFIRPPSVSSKYDLSVSITPPIGLAYLASSFKKAGLDYSIVESMLAAIQRKMIVRFNIIIGFPDETRKDIWKDLKFIIRMAKEGATDVFLNIYSPYPGSELFDDLKGKGVIGDELDDAYFHSLTFTNAFSILEVRCNKNISIVELIFCRSIGFFLFYILTYTTRPGLYSKRWQIF